MVETPFALFGLRKNKRLLYVFLLGRLLGHPKGLARWPENMQAMRRARTEEHGIWARRKVIKVQLLAYVLSKLKIVFPWRVVRNDPNNTCHSPQIQLFVKC